MADDPPRRVDPPHHPSVARELARADDVQVRVADVITRFAGSMPFVYVHVVAFAAWMLLVEGTPWPSLTLVVSLEAIFLSTFVMIGQNRQAAFQHAKADQDFLAQEQELHRSGLDTVIEHAGCDVAVVPTGPGDDDLRPWPPGPARRGLDGASDRARPLAAAPGDTP